MAAPTFSALLADRARRAPEEPVVVDDRETLTARGLDTAATSLAHTLRRRGVGLDDTVAVSMANSVDVVIACVGVWRAGATPQLLDPRLRREERAALEGLDRPAAAIGAAPVDGSIPWLPSARVAPDAGPLPDLAASSWKAATTSGSTGRPKIVRAAAPARLDPERPVAAFLPRTGTQLVAGPLWHSAVFTYAFRGLLTGQRLVVMDRFSPENWIDRVETHRVTWGLLVPTMMARLLRLPEAQRDPARVTSLHAVLHMGAPCPPDLKRAFLAWLGPERVDEVYAGSESNGLTLIGGVDWLAHPGSVGRPIGGTRLRIRDDRGDDVPTGRPGRIWMHRGDDAAYAYVGARSRRDADGWDTLDDIGHVDADGFLFVHDRADDIVNRAGTKVAPATVESALASHPDVVEAVAFGVRDDDLGSAVHAVVRLTDDPAPLDDILAFARSRLAPVPLDALHVTTSPLRNDAGKVRRSSLADEFAPHA